MASTLYTAIVQKKVKSAIPKLNGKGKPILQGPDGKPLPVNPDTGDQIGDGTPMLEVIVTETTDNPLTDEAGNVIEAGNPEALLRRVKEHFDDQEDTEVLKIVVREIKTVQEVSGEELAKVK